MLKIICVNSFYLKSIIPQFDRRKLTGIFDEYLINSNDELRNIYICSRELNNNNIIANKLFNHWSLRIIGNKKLFLIDFTDNRSQNKKTDIFNVNVVVLNNKCDNRKLFWYYLDSSDKHNYLTKRWELIEELRVPNNINPHKLYVYIEQWMYFFGEYNVLKNNCQHFCRDIIT